MYIDTLSLSFGINPLSGGTSARSGMPSGRGAAFAVSQTSIGREEIETFAAEIRRRADLGLTATDADPAGDGRGDGTDAQGAALAAPRADRVGFIPLGVGAARAVAAPKASGRGAVGGCDLFVPLAGAVEFASGWGRVGKEEAKVAKELDMVEKKLHNGSFTSRAPAEVVEKEREKSRAAHEKLDRLRELTTRIQGLMEA